jgi:hypothetical protein
VTAALSASYSDHGGERKGGRGLAEQRMTEQRGALAPARARVRQLISEERTHARVRGGGLD